jgi:hypothetical protein
MNRVRVLFIVMPVTYVLVVTLLSIVYSDTCDIGFGDYIVEYCISGITIYNTQQCNHQNLCHRHHYIQYSTM